MRLQAVDLGLIFMGKAGVRMVPGCGACWKSSLAMSPALPSSHLLCRHTSGQVSGCISGGCGLVDDWR